MSNSGRSRSRSRKENDDDIQFIAWHRACGMGKTEWMEMQIKQYIKAFPNCTPQMLYVWIHPEDDTPELFTIGTLTKYLSNIKKHGKIIRFVSIVILSILCVVSYGNNIKLEKFYRYIELNQHHQ